jgi:hypothetical protein
VGTVKIDGHKVNVAEDLLEGLALLYVETGD